MKYCILAMTALAILSACTPAAVVSGAAKGGMIVAQERTVGSAIDDNVIRLELNHLFLQKDANDIFANISTSVHEGRVLLTGDVTKPQSKIEAEKLTWQVDGVREVINEIEPQDTTGIYDSAKDLWVTAQINGRLWLEKGLSPVNYNIEVLNGKVFLLGLAKNQHELDRVILIARTTKYVKEVVSHVVMIDDPRRK